MLNNRSRRDKIFGGVLALSILLRIIYIFRPTAIWWDASVYIGMGKWLFSDQTYGFFEPFRPLLWPFVQGIIWKLGLNNLFWGSVLQVLFTMGVLILVYKIGERIRPYVGLIASTLLSFTPFFFGFTNVGLTDIPSVFFALFSTWYIFEKKYFSAGFLASIAFLLRFPHALFAVGVMIYLFFEFLQDKDLKSSARKAFRFCIGFAILGIPFFISNYILYQDILYPLKTGVALVSTDVLLQTKYFYYVINLFRENPLLIFAPIALIPFLKLPWKRDEGTRLILFTAVITIIYFAYFTHLGHKEVRYSIGFLPFLTLLGSSGLFRLDLHRKIAASLVGITAFILMGVVVFQIVNHKPLQPERRAFYEYFQDKTGSTLITSTPMIISVANVKLVGVFDMWENALNAYESGQKIDYAALDTCGLGCKDKECKERSILMEKLENEASLEFKKEVGSCELFIYKIKK